MSDTSGKAERDQTNAAPAIERADASSALDLDAVIERLVRARSAELQSALVSLIRPILAEFLESERAQRSEAARRELEALTVRRARVAAEVERARAELDLLRARVAAARRELGELERGMAGAAEQSVPDAAEPEGPAPDPSRETRLVITNLSSLGEAMRVRKSARQLPGVLAITFPRFEDGTMTVAVRHAPDLNLAAAIRSVEARLSLTRSDTDALEFRVENGP